MLNISFLACTKVELWDLIVCIAVNGPISNLSELFSYTTTYLNFMFLDQFLFEVCAKTRILRNTEKWKHTQTHTHRL